MSKHDKDFLIACFVVALAIFIFWTSMRMPMRGDVIESPAVFPGLMSVILFIFGVAYAIRSLSSGRQNQTGPTLPFRRALIYLEEKQTDDSGYSLSGCLCFRCHSAYWFLYFKRPVYDDYVLCLREEVAAMVFPACINRHHDLPVSHFQ